MRIGRWLPLQAWLAGTIAGVAFGLVQNLVHSPRPEIIPDDPAAGPANRAAIQAMIDGGTPKVVLPAGSVYIDRPLWGRSNLEITGPSTLRMVPGSDDGPIVLMPRDAGGPLHADQSPDLFGRLDATAATQAGKRWGYRTGPDGHLAQSAGLLAILSGYWECRRWTIEFALDTTAVPLPARGELFGLQDGRAEPSPWYLMMDQGRFFLAFKTTDGVIRSCRFNAPKTRGLNRVVIQMDGNVPTLTAWVDGVRVAIDGAPTAGPLTLAANEDAPFLFGESGGSALGSSDGDKIDLTLAGLRLSTVPRYVVGEVGSRIARIDGQTINDANTFFAVENGVVAWLPLDDRPETRAADRMLTVRSPSSSGSVLILTKAHAKPEANIGGIALHDFAIRGGNPWLGIGVTMANTLHVNLTGLSIGDVAIPISCIGTSANYPVLIERCLLNGTDCGAMARFGMWTMRDNHMGRAGRTAFRGDRAAQVRIDGLMVEGVGTPETIFRLTDGCRVAIRNLDVDFEDGVYPSRAVFYVTPGGHHARTASLDLETIGNGAMPATAPFVWLAASPGVTANALFGMRDLSLANPPAAYVRVTGAAWSGGFSAAELIQGWPSVPVQRKGEGVRSKIRVRE